MSIRTEELSTALAAFKHIGTRKVQPIMEHIRFRAEAPGVLRMTACDAESETEYTIEANLADMDLCVPAQRFAAIVANAGDAVEMKPVATGLSITSGTGRYRLPTMPGPNMPTIALEEAPSDGLADYTAIREAIAVCRFATAKMDLGMPAINGVNIRAKDGHVTVTAANRRVVASQSFELMVADFDVILPAKSAEIAISEKYTLFSIHYGVLQLLGKRCGVKLKLMPGQYPSMERILNAEKCGALTVERDALTAALDAVATVKDEKVGACFIRAKDNVMQITSGSDTGDAEQKLDYLGDAVEFNINIEQLHAIAKRSPEKVEFYWGKGFPVESGTPLLTRNGALTMGSVTTRV